MSYKIFKGHNLYQLLIYLLITEEEERYFFLSKKSLPNKVKEKIELTDKYIYLLENEEKKISFLDKTIFLLKKYLYYKIIFYKKYKFLFGSEILGDSNDNIFFIKNFKISIIEDGIGTYDYINSRKDLNFEENDKKKEKIKKKIKFFIKNFVNLIFFQNFEINNYHDKKISKFYLTGIKKIPDILYQKTNIIELKKLWNEKTEEEKEKILRIFNFNKNILKKIRNKKFILFTQPLEAREISEDKKIKIYANIISNYDKRFLILKKHPREKTDYKKYFKDVTIIEEEFPAELFYLLNVEFDKVITLFSTAVFGGASKTKIDFYGIKLDSKLLKTLK
ncbi:glycosyltransferase family 52 [Fusobacterium sp. THCT1E2]